MKKGKLSYRRQQCKCRAAMTGMGWALEGPLPSQAAFFPQASYSVLLGSDNSLCWSQTENLGLLSSPVSKPRQTSFTWRQFVHLSRERIPFTFHFYHTTDIWRAITWQKKYQRERDKYAGPKKVIRISERLPRSKAWRSCHEQLHRTMKS